MQHRFKGFFFNVIAAVAAVFTAIICFTDFSYFFGGTRLFLEIMLLLTGTLVILSFIQSRKTYFKPGWILMQGFMFIFLGLIFIFIDEDLFSEDFIRYSFGMLALCTAGSQIACGIQLNTLQIRHWKIPVVVGLLNLILALVSILGLFEIEHITEYTIGAYFILFAVGSLLEFFVRKS